MHRTGGERVSDDVAADLGCASCGTAKLMNTAAAISASTSSEQENEKRPRALRPGCFADIHYSPFFCVRLSECPCAVFASWNLLCRIKYTSHLKCQQNSVMHGKTRRKASRSCERPALSQGARYVLSRSRKTYRSARACQRLLGGALNRRANQL